MIDLRQTKEYAKYMELLGWEARRLSENYIYIKDLKLFSYIKLQRLQSVPTKENINDFINKTGGFIIFTVEANDAEQERKLKGIGFKKLNSSSLPSKTIRFDLKKSDNQLMTKMHNKTRYNIRLAGRRNVKIRIDDQIDMFVDFWHSAAKKRGMLLSLKKEILAIYKAFGINAEIIWALKNSKRLAAVLVLYTPKAGYYMYAASTPMGNKDQAPSLLVWEALKNSKKRDKEYFDFEGIYDERYPIKSWKGFSRFKRSFGGQVIELPGTMRKLFIPHINY